MIDKYKDIINICILSICRQQGEVARGNKPPAYLSKHKKLSPKTIAAEAKEVVCAVRSIIEAERK